MFITPRCFFMKMCGLRFTEIHIEVFICRGKSACLIWWCLISIFKQKEIRLKMCNTKHKTIFFCVCTYLRSFFSKKEILTQTSSLARLSLGKHYGLGKTFGFALNNSGQTAVLGEIRGLFYLIFFYSIILPFFPLIPPCLTPSFAAVIITMATRSRHLTTSKIWVGTSSLTGPPTLSWWVRADKSPLQ